MNIGRRNSQFLGMLDSLRLPTPADYRAADRAKQLEIRARWQRTFEDHPDAQVRAAVKDWDRETFKEGWVENEDARPTGMQDDAGDITKGDLGA